MKITIVRDVIGFDQFRQVGYAIRCYSCDKKIYYTWFKSKRRAIRKAFRLQRKYEKLGFSVSIDAKF